MVLTGRQICRDLHLPEQTKQGSAQEEEQMHEKAVLEEFCARNMIFILFYFYYLVLAYLVHDIPVLWVL